MNREEYREYLRSPTWRAIKDAYWATAIPKTCYGCGTGPPLDLHHKTYTRVGGKESIDDFLLLCRSCHDWVHKLVDQAVARGANREGALLRAARYVRLENKKRRPFKDHHDRRSWGNQPIHGSRRCHSLLKPSELPR